MPMRRKKPRPSTQARERWHGNARHRSSRHSDHILLYGLHAAEAALANPNRQIHRLIATENAARRLETVLAKRRVAVEEATPQALDRLLSQEAVHQGVVLETEL